MDYVDTLRVFVRVVELGSFSKAALDRSIKISSVSRAIAALEDDLGVSLFHRTTRRLHPTQAGANFYDQVKRILADLETARLTAASSAGSHKGELRLNVPPMFAHRILAPLLIEFASSYPEIYFEVNSADASWLAGNPVDLISSGADIAIRYGYLADSSLIAKKLARLCFTICASPDYLAAREPITSPEQLHQMECLMYRSSQVFDRWLFSKDGTDMFVEIGARMKTDIGDLLLNSAILGAGVALLPAWLVASDVAAGKLEKVLPDWQVKPAKGEWDVWCLYPADRMTSHIVRAFIDFITDRISQLIS